MVGHVLGLQVARDADIAQLGHRPVARQQDIERLQVAVHDLRRQVCVRGDDNCRFMPAVQCAPDLAGKLSCSR